MVVETKGEITRIEAALGVLVGELVAVVMVGQRLASSGTLWIDLSGIDD
jgi:hypothetical protein